jgi:hypothetical protein
MNKKMKIKKKQIIYVNKFNSFKLKNNTIYKIIKKVNKIWKI